MDKTSDPAGTATREPCRYLSGFGNEFATEAVAGALPSGRNSPQRPPRGLYAEQFSTTAFTVPRKDARRAWLYRIRPSAAHGPFRRIGNGTVQGPLAPPTPNRLRWSPLPLSTTWVFLGLLGGRELALAIQRRRGGDPALSASLGADLLKASLGLGVSLTVALAVPLLKTLL